MKEFFYATHNKFKVQNMKERLDGLDIKIVSPADIGLELEPEENGNTTIENAIIKAKAYRQYTDLPILGADTGMFVENFAIQPGLFVRRASGRELDDEELEDYYIQEITKIGGKTNAHYYTGLAILKGEDIYTVEIEEEGFVLKSERINAERKNDLLGRISFDENIGKYICELNEQEKRSRDNKFSKECIEFIQKYI